MAALLENMSFQMSSESINKRHTSNSKWQTVLNVRSS